VSDFFFQCGTLWLPGGSLFGVLQDIQITEDYLRTRSRVLGRAKFAKIELGLLNPPGPPWASAGIPVGFSITVYQQPAAMRLNACISPKLTYPTIQRPAVDWVSFSDLEFSAFADQLGHYGTMSWDGTAPINWPGPLADSNPGEALDPPEDIMATIRSSARGA
jgi:hypothetical protein